MANADIPNGFRPVGTLAGASYNGQMTRMFSDADNLFLGDIVIKNAVGGPSGDGAYLGCDRATSETATIAVGVVVGWEADPDNLTRPYHASSTSLAVFIATDPNIIFRCQEDGTGAVAAADVGLNYDIQINNGSTSSGASNMELLGGSSDTVALSPLKLVGLANVPDNEPGAVRAKCDVILNMHVATGGTGTVGI